MPIYEYACTRCGHIMEAIQKISDPALTICPVCHKNGLRKQVTAAAFHLKGTGWYVTDFKDNKSKIKKDDKDKSAEIPATGETEKSDTPATETKKTDPVKKSGTTAAK